MALLSLSLISNVAGAVDEKSKTLRVCSEAGYVPFEMINAQGTWDGYEIALVRKFSAEYGYKLVIKNISYDGLVPSLVSRHDCDLLAADFSMNVKRGEMIEFSHPIITSTFAAIVQLNDKDKFNSFDKINDSATRMAVQSGTEDDTYVKKYAKNVTKLGYDNNVDPVLAVLMNKADIFIEDIIFLRLMQKKYPGKFALIEPKVLPNNPDVNCGFVLNKENKTLIHEVNEFIDKISGNGELAKIKKSYFDDMIWMDKYPL